MKKVLILILAVAMTIALVACGTKNADGTTTTTTTTKPTEQTTTTKPAEQTTEKPAEQTTTKPAETEKPADVSLENIAHAVIATEGIEFSPMVSEIEVGAEWMPGFTSTITGFTECWQFAPMIGVMPFVGYVFRVADGTDIEAFKAQLKEKANLSWNICTLANTTICENQGNIVMFAMINIEADMGLPVGTDAKMIASFNAALNK